jgi:hypothetical protein
VFLNTENISAFVGFSWKIKNYNRQIEKRVKSYPNVKLFDLDRHYTTQGQHLNSLGKELNANKLAIKIKDMHVRKQHTPIQIPWKDLLGETIQSKKSSENLTLNTETLSIHP